MTKNIPNTIGISSDDSDEEKLMKKIKSLILYRKNYSRMHQNKDLPMCLTRQNR